MAGTDPIKEEHNFRVRLPLRHHDINNTLLHDWKVFMDEWDRQCEIAFDMLGPPGEKYSCRLTKEASEFWFKDETDALMFELRCG